MSLQCYNDWLLLFLIGVNGSFHVGSGCYDAQAFGDAVTRARKAFDIGKSLGFNFTLLDGMPYNLSVFYLNRDSNLVTH